MFDSLFTRIYEYFNPNWDFQIGNSLTDFRNYLNGGTNPIIRMYASDSNGYGHQASTVGLLRQLINTQVNNGFDYTGTIEVYYGEPETLAKLYVLLPELLGNPIGPVGGATVQLIQSTAIPPALAVNLGFTGGADDTFLVGKTVVPNFAIPLNTRYFLRLQPYKWYLGQNQIQFNSARKFITLTDQEVLGYSSFAERAYYVPVPIPAPTWANYGGGNYANQAAIAQWITGQTVYDYTPVYGINNLSKSMYARPVADRVFEVIVSLLASQVDNGNPAIGAKSIVILHLGNFADPSNRVFNLLNGAESENEFFSTNRLVNLANRRAYLHNVNAANRVRFVWNATMGNINAELAWLNASTDRILFVQVGSLPKPIFNYLLQMAPLPPVFEGQGTANDALNIGKYYFHVALETVGMQYPMKILGLSKTEQISIAPGPGHTIYFPSKPTYMQSIANQINEAIYNWPSDPAVSPAEMIGDFIKDYREEAANGPLHEYFTSIATFYQDTNNDKFRYAVSFLNYIIQKTPVPQARRVALSVNDDESVLGKLLADLQANLNSEQTLNLIPGVFSGGAIFSFYNGLMGPFSITNAVITPTDENDAVSNIVVTGNNAALGIPLTVSITFTAPEDVIVSDTQFTYNEAWAPSQLPWFKFSNPFIQFTILNAQTLTSGKVGGTIDGADVTLAIQLPIKDGKWQLTGDFSSPYPSISKFFQLAGGVNLTQTLPAPFNAMAGFGLQNTQLVYDSKNNVIEYVGFNFSTDQTYPLLGKLTLNTITAHVMVQNPSDLQKRYTNWSLNALFSIGSGDNAGIVGMGVTGPDIAFTGILQSGVILPTDLFSIFLPWAEFNSPSQPSITEFQFNYEMKSGNYSVTCLLNIEWDITIAGSTIFTINTLGVAAGKQGETFIGGLNGTITILPDDPNVNLLLFLSATYNSSTKGWTFVGQQVSGVLSISGLIKEYLKWDSPINIDINGLSVSMDTATNYWEFAAQTAKPWEIPFLGVSIKGKVVLGYDENEKTKTEGNYGKISGEINWNGIDLTVFYNFDPSYSAYGIKWGLLEGKVEKDKITGNQVATLQFTESTTLGSIVETFVSWATGSKFGLSSPWDLLNEVPLNNLALTYDFTDEKVGFKVNIGPINLGFITITGITISYNNNDPLPENNGVMVTLDITSAWGPVPSWNAAKPETTPAPPGQGNKYLDLKMLAMGQHVSIPDLQKAETVQDAIKYMENLPATKPGVIQGVTLATDSSWLIGMDFGILKLEDDSNTPPSFFSPTPPTTTLLANTAASNLQVKSTVKDTVTYKNQLAATKSGQVANAAFTTDNPLATGMDSGIVKLKDQPIPATAFATNVEETGYMLTMQVIFNDPNLYALRVALEGDAAKVFKGLDFQIMYKKVSDTVGVYQTEITLPDAMRQIKMGAFNITLPVFAIQIYTNGDFLVDIGFPWNQDFSRSLTFQGWIVTPVGPIPVMGSVGIYFGKLSSATTSRVPQTTTGTFNPVLVFGFGIQFGFGFSFNAGILSAGFSLTAIAILEGLLAKWNPYAVSTTPSDTGQLETSYYFWFRGTVGIIGKLYGSIDFAIIKADLNIDMRIIAQITFASYEPILISITASVDVSLKVTINLGIFKIHISFSFSARISQSVTINAIGGTPPWKDTSSLNVNLLSRKRSAGFSMPAMRTTTLQTPVWSNLTNTTPVIPLKGYIANGLTMAGDAATQLSDQLACYVTMLFIESVPAPQADNSANIKKAFEIKSISNEDTSFELLSKMIFRWAIASVQSMPHTSAEIDDLVITDAQLELLQEYLNNPGNPVPIPLTDIGNFMNGQFALELNTSGSVPETDATFFPVPEGLNFSVPDYGNYKALSYNYEDYNSLSGDYINSLSTYFNDLAVLVKKETEQKSRLAATDTTTSMSSFVFCDYFLIICRQLIQAGRDSLKDFKYFLQPNDTPASIIAYINKNGQPDYSIVELFNNNSTVALNAANRNTMVISNSNYQIQSNDTFDSISKLSMYNGFDGAALAKLNADTKNILSAGAIITYPGLDNYTSLPGQSLTDIAKALSINKMEIVITVDDLISKGNVLTLAKLLLPSALISIPPFDYKIVEGDQLRAVASKFNISQADLASPAANGKIVGLFDSATVKAIDIVSVNQFKVSELLKEIQATGGLQTLSGMTSRFYMAGMRLPTNGVTPLYPGMWVKTDENKKMTLPDYAGLYALTGQQFQLPQLSTGNNFVITYTSSNSWLKFSGANPQQGQITLIPGKDDALRIEKVQAYALANRLEMDMSFLGTDGTFNSDNSTFPFTSQIIWNNPAPIEMPYGGIAPGVPAFRLWQLPDTLLQLPDLSTRAINPQMKMFIGQYNSATGSMDNSDVNYYGYATRAEFSVKKIPVIADSPSTQMMYEIDGADGTNAIILEKIVKAIGSDDSKISTVFISYTVNQNGSAPAGIQTDDAAFITMGISQVNLSTETKPGAALRMSMAERIEENPGLTLLNKKSEFITLLWEASITRSGGFYLYYYNSESGTGLPDSIFNDKGEATIQLLVLYPQATVQEEGAIADYYNALVTAQAIDTSDSVLFAQSNPVSLNIATDNVSTLAGIAYSYFENVADLAADNQTVPLRSGITMKINEGVYEVGPGALPGGDLNAIANYFGTTVANIKAANPKKTNWQQVLPLFTSILLPEIDVLIGTANGGVTLQSLSTYYGQNLSSLAAFNENIPGIFADNGSLLISGGPITRTAAVPAGVSSVYAVRTVPPAIPDDPNANDYGKFFLQNTFGMLSYQLMENEFFKSSNISLPSGPTSSPSGSGNDKIRVPKEIVPGDNWIYRQSIPYSRFSKQLVTVADGLPDPNESPYRGLGDLLKIDFVWQDYYGNRLITDLSQPSSTDKTKVLNQPALLTGYTDLIIGLNQWPSVASTWLVTTPDTILSQLLLRLTFDTSPYEGLNAIAAKNDTTIIASFTTPLDALTAQKTGNYALAYSENSEKISIVSVTLNDDQRSVTIQVNAINSNEKIRLTIGGINSSDGKRTFSGVAEFALSEQESTTPVTDSALRDLAVYKQLWYQLNDPNGIEITVKTSLCSDNFILSPQQLSDLIGTWIASIYTFLTDRSSGGISVAVPATEKDIVFEIDKTKLNAEEIFKLNASFVISRTGGAIAGDFETSGGVKQVSTDIAAYSGKQGTTYTSDYFAQEFEKAMKVENKYVLRVASGVDRTENNSSSGGREIWSVRTGLDETTGISYQVNNPGAPAIFVPRPISNKLESRTQVPIYDFNGNTAIDFNTPSRYLNFSEIDMDMWGKIVFGAMDYVLSPEFVSAILIVDNKLSKTYYKDMLSNKTKLADIIKLWMIPVFENEDSDATVIQESFKQQLLVQLSNAYNVNAGIQFAATVEADTPEGISPRLYGNINLNFCFIGVSVNVTDYAVIDLFFNSAPDLNEATKPENYSVQDLLIISATVDPQNQRKVTLQLNGKAIPGTTKVTLSNSFLDSFGNVLTPPFDQIVQLQIDTGNYSDSVSITSAKLELTPSAQLPLSFLLTSPQIVKDVDGAVVSWLDLDLTYSGAFIEHQITQLSPTNLYFPSSWLNFITPDGNDTFISSLGKFKVPMVLRAFPSPPTMITQNGKGSVDPNEKVDFNKILNWDYEIRYSMPFHFPQDRLFFTINFNVTDNKGRFFAMRDAFAELAEFITVFPDINKVLTDSLAKIDATTTDPALFNKCAVALESYNDMVGNLISASSSSGLSFRSAAHQRVSKEADAYHFTLSEGKTTISGADALIISIDQKAPDGVGDPLVQLENCVTHLYSGNSEDVYCFYFTKDGKIVSATDGQKITVRSILFPDMNIFARQDAETIVELKRNVLLIDKKPTAEPFIYTTGSVGFSNNCHPTITYDKQIEISTIGAQPGQNNTLTLAEQLNNFFSALLLENTQSLLSFQMTCTYSYSISNAIGNIALPVFMQPLQDIVVGTETQSGKSLEQLIEDWAGAIKLWYTNYQPVLTNASFWFNLRVFSNLTEQPLPLIALSSLSLECKYIKDLALSKQAVLDAK